MTREKRAERMARVLYLDEPSYVQGETIPWDRLTQPHKRRFFRKANAILSDMDAAGEVVVPREATERMLDAGRWCVDFHDLIGDSDSCRGQMKDAWTAMIAAAETDQ